MVENAVATKFGIGQSVRRSEDPRLLTGRGRYTDDLSLPDQAHAFFLRSPFAHATIRSIDAEAARSLPGVVGIVTGADLEADGISHLSCQTPVTSSNGREMVPTPRPALAVGRVRHVGDPVALIVAEDLNAARDAAEAIDVDYDSLPAIADPVRALEPDAPQVWDEVPGNLVFDWEMGDAAAVDSGFARADHVVELQLANNRVVANPMETRACLAAYDAAAESFTFHVSSQGAHDMRDTLADDIFRVPRDRFHVLTGDVGGGFGMKLFMYPEYVATLYAARKFGRPVRWMAERTEAFISDDHGRDNVTRAKLALDADGRFLAFRVDTVANMGGYLSGAGPFVATAAGNRMLSGLYDLPAIHTRVRGVYTNTQPVDAYRGAGRPEAAFTVERMVDAAARQLGIAPAELRRRNFIRPKQMPHKTALGLTYDSGEFERNMNDALDLADIKGFDRRRADSRARGKLRGLGLSTYIEACAGGPAEAAHIEVARTGEVTVYAGTQSNGQGHETAYQQIVANHLGVAPERVVVVQGDTARIRTGTGTGGSRSIPVGGMAVNVAAERVLEQARLRAADLMEAAAADVEVRDGRFTIVGTDRSMSFAKVAERSEAPVAFDERGEFKPPAATFPNGAHVCELEVDVETGAVEIVAYTVVDDFGVVLNPLLLEGQVHGGVAQGVGQALMEHTAFDPETAQLLSGSFMDYAMPRADALPFIKFRYNIVPCRTNPMGMKGAGEAGAIGAPPAVINALVDALAEFGVRHLDMPALPETIWRLIPPNASREAAE
ncbi:MAG TPA: xanthine dehydrogenase family protein molybdopterin-binding subunit [Alphaproteobacteria bacterium]|nr:xanthine dehydrogenase family protein molybdopterin-binding subunit [Alphaproteobacteria bacterium]